MQLKEVGGGGEKMKYLYYYYSYLRNLTELHIDSSNVFFHSSYV